MENFSLPKRLYLAYLGRALALTYFSQRRQILWIPISSWLKGLSFAFIVFALIFRWGQTAVFITLFIFFWIQFSYWRAGKMGYNKFVVDETGVLPQAAHGLVAPNEKITVRASGTFAVSHRDSTLFMHPAEYWRAPLGDHIIMVQESQTQYLYQFFTTETLQKIEKGWIIFGKEPLQTLALTIQNAWGPDFNNNAIQYYVGGGQTTNGKQRLKTIYFTFDQQEELNRVWGSIVTSMRQARMEAGD